MFSEVRNGVAHLANTKMREYKMTCTRPNIHINKTTTIPDASLANKASNTMPLKRTLRLFFPPKIQLYGFAPSFFWYYSGWLGSKLCKSSLEMLFFFKSQKVVARGYFGI